MKLIKLIREVTGSNGISDRQNDMKNQINDLVEKTTSELELVN